MTRVPPVLGSVRELGTVTLVAGLSGCYAATLIMTSSILASISSTQGDGDVAMLLGIVSPVFIGIALYVAAVVITGCVTTVIAGRLQHIALLRLLGADGLSLRRSVRRSTARAGAIGACLGVLAGVLLTDVVRVVLVHRGALPDLPYRWAVPPLALPIAAVALCSVGAGWIGSRAVLHVAPVQALSAVQAQVDPARRTTVVRAALAVTLIGVGVVLLMMAVALGDRMSTSGFLCAFLGAAVSGTGVIVGARFLIPWVVTALGRLLGGGPPSLIARRNAVADPSRTTRSTIGLIVGVVLITTIASGMSALRAAMDAASGLSAAQRHHTDQVMAIITAVLVCLVVISSIIAAVGFVSTMSLTVIQRRREIGLLRSLGFTAVQVRAMITRESIALSATAVILGAAIGVVYGSVGAQSLVGAMSSGFVWGVPWVALAAVAVAGGALVLVASRPPARRAVSVPPVVALRATD
ncbi:ABC transporter permease [Allobranchiibius sp. GilTou38]|uniref:ABC transporter permease n=1 Tax=Allobranchiibius sp. GilTou38 TaxID=2815210 RepID=UPI001AA14AE7|nr:ABC transporter permease [Allobranchiibius sp. GilTou38]MBO1766166.1 FtsX-like permease family protein [Allobranchiibius sp. GilTou38]